TVAPTCSARTSRPGPRPGPRSRAKSLSVTAPVQSPGGGLAAARGPGRSTPVRRLSSWLHRHAGVRLAALLSAPMAWLVVAYLGSLAVLFVSSLWTIHPFTGNVVK